MPTKLIYKSRGKIRNVTSKAKLKYKGIQFKSALEVFMFKELEKLKVKFGYEEKTYTILEGFTFNGEKIRPIRYTPDFELRDYPVVIETKGYPNES